jgi:hypothetical protein
MGALGISNGVLNQKGSPAIYTDVYANRPAAGFNGRLFVSTDTSQIFEDNGTSWILIANSGIGSTGTLQVVTTNGNTTNTGITITAGGINTNAARVSGLTQDGGVLFTDGSGNLGQDVNFNWDITNNYLGIGPTGTPTAPLDIHNAAANVFMQLNATSTNNSTIAFQNASVGKWRIGNLYSAGANTFHIYNNVLAGNALTITAANVATFTGAVIGASLAITGGTSSQFLKANGTTDSTAYISLTSLSATSPLVYNNATGAFTILQSSSTQSGYLSSTDWTTFNNKASLGSFSATTPLAYNSGTGAFTIQVANSGQSGYLTSTDWNTFNGKQSALTFGNLTESTSSVLTIAGGTGAVIGSGTTIQIKQSSASQNGYLSSTDWTTFNSKQAQINGTGFVKASGTTISYDNSTYYLASNPSNYITLSSLSGTTPISYNTGTGAISIAQSNTSTSGYLSSTDWNTFNSKASLTAFSASPPLSYNSGTGAFSISQSSASTNGYLSSTDWSTFNSKQSALTNPVTGTGTSGYVVKFNGSTTVTNSIIEDSGSALTINGAASSTSLITAQSGFNVKISANGTSPTYQYENALIYASYNSGIFFGNQANSNNNMAIKLKTSNDGTLVDALTLIGNGAATFSNTITSSSRIYGTTTGLSSDFNGGGLIAYGSGNTLKYTQIGFDSTGNYGWIQPLFQGTSYNNLALNPNGGIVNIGTSTSGTGTLNVYSASSDNHINAIGATAPSIRIDNAVTSATQRIGLGLATATNNFIQGSANGNMCIFNQSTTPNPILFGVYNSGLGYTPEAMRVSSLNNLLVGSPTDDTVNKLQVNGNVKVPVSNTYNSGSNAIKSTNSVSVSTSATTIFSSQNVGSVDSGNLVVVTGVLSGTGANFCDVVLFMTNGSATTISSQIIGVPSIRTYSVSGNNLRLTMSSGNYVVATGGFIQGYNTSF